MINDPLAESLAKKDRARNEFSGAVRVGVQQNPDEFAKALKLSAETGVMPEAVLRDMKAFDESSRAARVAKIYDTHPKTSSWLKANPALAHDDLASIVNLEPALDFVKPPETGFGETLLGSFIQGSGRLGKGLATDLSRLGQSMNQGSLRAYAGLVDMLAGNDVASRGVERGLKLAEEARSGFDAAVFDPGQKSGGEMVNPDRWFAQAIGGSAPDIIVGLATAGAGPAVSASTKAAPAAGIVKGLIFRVGRYLAARTPQIAAQTATSLPSVLSSEIDQMQRNAPGMDRVDAAGAAAPSAVIQSILEGLVEVPLIERAQKAKGVVKRITGLLASSGMEGAEEVAQAITSQYLLPDPTGQRTLELKDIWENARGGFAAGLVFGGGAMLTKPMKVTPEETFFKALDDGAKDSKLLKRMPEKYQELLSHLTKDGPVENVGIPVQQWGTYWQSKDVDPVAKAAELGIDAESYQNAVMLADDLTISTAAFGTKIAGTEDFAGLLPDVRYRQGMETARESEAAQADEKARVDEILARFKDAPEEGAAVEVGTLKESLKAQLIDAGRPAKEAEAQATLFERSIATLAVRNDITPEAMLSRFKLSVNNGQVMAQPLSDVMGGVDDSGPAPEFNLDPGMDPDYWQSQGPRLQLADSTSYQGNRLGDLLGPNDEQIVARDSGKDIGRLWVTKVAGGFEVRKVETDPAFRGRGVATRLYREAAARYGPYAGSTDQTPEGKALVESLRQTNPEIFGAGVPRILYQSDGQTLYQPMKRRTEDYKKLRARMASLRSLSPTHQSGELTRRALEAKAIEAEFQAFNKEVREMGDIEGKRAYLQIGPDHSFNLGLLKNANVSSASHEFGHFYLEILSDLASREGATQQTKDDYETIVKHYGTDGAIDREGHERFADAHLLYLSEGRAPSVDLQGPFQRFSTWLAKVWATIKADMVDVQLTDEVRGVFDRLYATDAEIEAVKDSLGRPMFKTAEEMGRTKDQFAVYLRAEETRKAEAREAAMRSLMLELKREQSKEWNELYDKVHARVKAEVEARPEYVALAALTAKDSEVKLSKKDLIARGVDLKSLAQDGIKYVYSDSATMDADTAATLLGYETGDQLIQAITGLESRVKLAERLTMDEVHQTFPNTMEDPAALRDLALKVLADSEAASDRMALEAQVLRDKLNEGKAAAKAKLPDMKAYRQAAIQMIQGMKAYGLRPDRYLLARGKASNEAYRANAKGDFVKANEAKEREILNHFLYMESVKVRDDLDRFEAFDKKFDSAKTRETIGKAGGSFLEQIDAMRLRFGLSLFPGENMGVRTETLAQWVERNEFAEVDDRLLDESWKKPVKDMTVAELNMVWDALKNIKALAYGETRFIVKGTQVSYELAGLEISEAITKNNTRKPGHISGYKESAKEKAINHLKGWDATLVKIEALVNWMDGGNVEGPAHRYLWQPLVDAQTARYDLTVNLALPLQDALREMPEAQRKTMDDTFTVDWFNEPLTRRQIISMLFNMGNEANRRKLIEGYEWSEYQVQQALANLNAADAAFVQATWDTIATLWPQMVALEKRYTGVEPKKQEIAPYTLYGKNGEVIAEMRGGYWPIKYDPKASEFGEKQLAGDAIRLATASRPGTSRSALKERTNAVGPLLLSFDYILQRHLTDVILDLTHRESLNSVDRLLKRKEVKTAIQEAFGDEYYRQFAPWLNTIAGDGSGAAAMGLDKWSRAAMAMRSNTVAAVLGFKATTVVVQFADLTRVLGPGDYRVKGRYYFEALGKFLGDPKGEIARVRELSGEMRHRPENLDRDIREVLKQMTGQQSIKDRYNRAAFKGIAFMDTWVSVTAWSGAFKQAMAEHGDADRAIMEADRVVRLKLMSGNPKDLVAVQRSNELMKLITMYLGDATSNYNLMRNAGHKAKGLGGFVTQFTPAAMLVMAGAIIGDLLKGQGPDDDEDKAQWYLRKAAMAPFQTIPGLRDGVRALDAKLANKPFADYQFTPAFAAIQKAINAIDITADMLGEEKDVEFGDWAVKAGEAIGYAFGIGGTAQAAASTKYLKRVNEGETVEGAIVDITGSEGAQVAYNATLGKPKKGTR